MMQSVLPLADDVRRSGEIAYGQTQQRAAVIRDPLGRRAEPIGIARQGGHALRAYTIHDTDCLEDTNADFLGEIEIAGVSQNRWRDADLVENDVWVVDGALQLSSQNDDLIHEKA